jgi:hypothetical protein
MLVAYNISLVYTIIKETTGITRLRSYILSNKFNISATIYDTALIISAATGFFDPIFIGVRRFVDGILGVNNPIDEVKKEASNI